MRAKWTSALERWDLCDEPGFTTLRRFRNAAVWAAQKSGKGDTWEAFLGILRGEPDTFEWTTTSIAKQFSLRHPDGIDVKVPNGEIKRVCEAAADYCEKKLPEDERDAIIKAAMERREQRSYEAFRPHAELEAVRPINQVQPLPDTETTASQIERLRQECRWTEEKLAEATELDPTTVSRHIRGQMQPSLRNLGRYEKTFSKELSRKVVIRKTPRKRR
ncbi:MAG: helix-turn-helix transcriptional regulator [Bryobacteraceae bacterium]